MPVSSTPYDPRRALMRRAYWRLILALLLAAGTAAPAAAQKRLVVIDQDTSGPGGSNIMSMMALLQSPQVEVLGIMVVTGNAWRDDEARHALRMLELIGRTDVPVALGAVFPLVRTQEETRLMTPLVGQVAWLGAWGRKPATVTAAPAGSAEPPTPAAAGSLGHAAAARGRTAHQAHRRGRRALPHQAGARPPARGHRLCGGTAHRTSPLAIAIDPHFAELARGFVVMGGSLNPQTDDPEFATSPRHEFNFWFDPEAARITLRAHWPRIDLTTVDVSIKAMFTRGHAGRDRQVPQSGRAIHRQVFPGAVLPVGRAGRLRLARSRHHHAGAGAVHGCRREPRSGLRRNADLERRAEARRTCSWCTPRSTSTCRGSASCSST